MDQAKEEHQICKKFRHLEGCGSCTVYLSDDTNIRKLTISSIASVIDILLGYCANNTNKKIILCNSTLTCKGDMQIECSIQYGISYIFENKKTCSSFIKLWYEYHKHILLDALNLVYISSTYKVLKSVYSQQEMKEKVNELQTSFNFLYDIE